MVLLAPLHAVATSFGSGYGNFTPTKGTFTEKLDGDSVAFLPAPTVTITKITRGSATPGASGDDAGQLSLDLNWPRKSIYKLSEVGFYFRVLGGEPSSHGLAHSSNKDAVNIVVMTAA